MFNSKLVEALYGMNQKFANPYIIFYPTLSQDGALFPINKCIREIQGHTFREEHAWRGNIVVAKCCENPFTSMMDASMADFAILKNYLRTYGAPKQVCPYFDKLDWSIDISSHTLTLVVNIYPNTSS
jgi:hypothetical protein